MKKADRKLLDESLSKALDPPRKKPRGNLDALLEEYDQEPSPSMTSLTSHTTTTRQTSQSHAPTRDFSKVPNSLTRVSIPAGEFKGKSKQLYDALYSMTRGSITPKRSVRISRPQLMKKAAIGARVTFDTNVTHLIAIGLLQVKQIAGEHEGNEYTVFLPEERTLTSQSSMTSQTSHAQDQDGLVSLESSQTRHSLSVDSINTSDDPKTSFKTKDQFIDDEAFAKLVAKLKEATREVTGKDSPLTDADRWQELAEVLIAELHIAAGRTTISSVPAFMAEHLRRRLWKLDKKQALAEGRELPDQPKTTNVVPDGQTCPDCNNTGWWYPNGPDKGVTRCKHTSLHNLDEKK